MDASSLRAPARVTNSAPRSRGVTPTPRRRRRCGISLPILWQLGLVTDDARVVCTAGCTKRSGVCLSVRMSRRSTAATACACGFAAERRRLQQISIDSGRRPRSAENAGRVVLRADLQLNSTTRTRPDRTKSANFVGDRLNSTTTGRPDFFAARVSRETPLGPCGSLLWVRSGPCSGI